MAYGEALPVAKAKQRTKDLEELFKLRGYTVKSDSPLLTRVVKTVFGNVDTLKKQNKVLSFNTSGKHYYIFDEVDNLSKTAQAGLKTTLNRPRGTFMLTTNNISQLDKGMKDRCVLVEMNAATYAEYLPLARRIPADDNVVLSDALLPAAIAGNNGSFRSVISVCCGWQTYSQSERLRCQHCCCHYSASCGKEVSLDAL